jgi:hypothetical protein
VNLSPASIPSQNLIRVVGTLALAVAAFDACFWEIHGFGCSTAIFFLILTGAILANRPGWRARRSHLVLLALIIGTSLASLIEPGVSNTFVWLVLLPVLAGHTFYTATENVWGRWLSQGVAMIAAPARVAWLIRASLDGAFGGKAGVLSNGVLGLLVILPALGLALGFCGLLSLGNAVFSLWTNQVFGHLWTMLAGLLDPLRLFLWALIGLLVLPLLRPATFSDRWWLWMTQLPRGGNFAPTRYVVLSSGLVLLTMNLLFGVANFADAFFLWHGAALPLGVTYSQFVHAGVESLILTVLLSGLVLTLIFQQSLEVVRHRGLRFLALLWIAQNLFLILSVALRLKSYIEAYDMTVARLGLILFLLLVALGYALLTLKILQDRSLSWLLGGLLLAAFGILYVTQFLNLAGWSADYNVARWQANPIRSLDVEYLEQLGPAAWPAWHRANQNAEVKEASRDLAFQSSRPKDWRGWTLRAYWNRGALTDPAP